MAGGVRCPDTSCPQYCQATASFRLARTNVLERLAMFLLTAQAAAGRCCVAALLPAADVGRGRAAGFGGAAVCCCCTAPMVDTVLRFPVFDGSGFLYSRCSSVTSTTAFSLRGVG